MAIELNRSVLCNRGRSKQIRNPFRDVRGGSLVAEIAQDDDGKLSRRENEAGSP